jgi:hypothetical protein
MHNTVNQPFSESVFGMSAEELREGVRTTAARIIRDAWDNNSYLTYFVEKLCPENNILAHEYCDRKELVLITENGETQVIQTLQTSSY